MVKQSDIEHAAKEFDRIDKDKSGNITICDVIPETTEIDTDIVYQGRTPNAKQVRAGQRLKTPFRGEALHSEQSILGLGSAASDFVMRPSPLRTTCNRERPTRESHAHSKPLSEPLSEPCLKESAEPAKATPMAHLERRSFRLRRAAAL